MALTEAARPAEFILSEASGGRSRHLGTLKSGQNLAAGTVLQKDADAKLVAFDGAVDSGGNADPDACGVLIYKADASGGDKTVVYIARDAEVNFKLLTYPAGHGDDTILSLRRGCGIIARHYGVDAGVAFTG